MKDKSVYDIIKRQNGEAFARAIRNFDSGIFEVDNLPQIVKYAGRNALPLLNYLESLKQIKIEKNSHYNPQDPFKLLKKAGYDAFYADTLEKQNSICNYYADMESLCTFRDFNRYQKYHIIHCIKEGAKDLNRKDFKKPKRQDAYGTSVISIQILKTGGFISIKNRYNHSVEAPDNTFNSNPDNIIAGLSQALRDYLGVDFASQEVMVEGPFLLIDNRIYRYNLETQNIYFSKDYYISDNGVFFINTDYQTIVDNFIVDFKKNKVFQVHASFPSQSPYDAVFELVEKEVQQGGKLSSKKEGDVTAIYLDEKCILKARDGQMIFLNLSVDEVLVDSIFVKHDSIEEVYLENATGIHSRNFKDCKNLRKVLMPNCGFVGDSCFENLPSLEEVNLEKIKTVGTSFFENVGVKGRLYFPNLKSVSMSSFCKMPNVQSVVFPNLVNMVGNTLWNNPNLTEIVAPNLVEMGGRCILECSQLKKVNLEKLVFVGPGCLSYNINLQEVDLPFVTKVASFALSCNENLNKVKMPMLEVIEDNALSKNDMLKKLSLPNVIRVDRASVSENMNLKVLHLPKLKKIEQNAFFKNPSLKIILFDTLETVNHCNLFLCSPSITHLYAPCLKVGQKVVSAVIGKHILSTLKQMPTLERDS